VGQPEVEGEAASLKTWLDFRPGSAVFEAFHSPTVWPRVRLREHGLTVTVSIHNRARRNCRSASDCTLFPEAGGEQDTLVCLPADSIMEATPDLLPTGRLVRWPARSATCAGPWPSEVGPGPRLYRPARRRARPHRVPRPGMSVRLEASGLLPPGAVHAAGGGLFCLENRPAPPTPTTCSTGASGRVGTEDRQAR